MFGFTLKNGQWIIEPLRTRLFGESLSSNFKLCIKWVSLNNRPFEDRQLNKIATLSNINSNEPLYYPFTVSVKKCGGSCNTTDYLCAPL